MKYHYFISYAWKSKYQNGFRNYEAVLDSPIESIDMLRDIETYLERELAKAGITYPSVDILNYQLLRAEKCD